MMYSDMARKSPREVRLRVGARENIIGRLGLGIQRRFGYVESLSEERLTKKECECGDRGRFSMRCLHGFKKA